ncbi:uncharacterized protein LOC112502868 [Cynara cardunculus var. scolymus]|uniref:uncharacterized protein LOC112502868 n=1 Tax=Cynara cardunculus var. scolymus TaxID=59895 RepID=UPI000D62B01F|nr:uncharacterized protein LOC112502868 [Cynara cardunculus var. scolymus]
MSHRDEVTADLSAVRVEVQEVKGQLSSLQMVVQANAEAIAALTSKADEAHTQFFQQAELMQQVMVALCQPALVPPLSFTVDDCVQLYEAPEEVDVVRAEACDDDLPITFVANVGDVEEDNEDDDDEEGESPDLPDSGSNLDDNDDDHDDKDDVAIQFQGPSTATKGVALKDYAS